MKRISVLFPAILLSWGMHAQQVDLVIQTGHSASVNGVAFSPDGKYIASACTDGSVKLWDAKLGFEIYTFYKFATYGYDVSFSPDGKYLLGTGASENVMWDLRTGKMIAWIGSGELDDAERGAETSKGIFSFDNKYCFGGREDHSIMRWDVHEMLHPEKYEYPYNEIPYEEDSSLELSPPSSAVFFKGHTSRINALAITNDNKFLVSAGDDSTIIIWNALTGQLIRKIKSPFEVESMVITPDGKKIISSDDTMDDQQGIRVWDMQTGKQLMHVITKFTKNMSLAVSPDGKYLAAGNLNSSITVYSLPAMKLTKTIKGHDEWINGIAFSKDGKRLVTCSYDNSIKVWDFASGRIVRDFRKTIAVIDELVYEKKHRMITTSSHNDKKQATVTWELDHGIGIKHQYSTGLQIRNDEFIGIDSAGTRLMITEDSAILLFDPVSGKLTRQTDIPRVGSAYLFPGGDRIFYQGRKPDSLFILETATGISRFFALHPETDTNNYFRSIDAIDLSHDGALLAIGGFGPDVFIMNAKTGQYLRNLNYLDADSTKRKAGTYHDDEMLTLPNSKIYDIAFSPDGKLVAAGVHFPDPIVTGGLIIVWDIATGDMLHWENAHIYPIQSLKWSPDGKLLVSGGNDKWVRVWRYEDFAEDSPEAQYSYMHDFTPLHTSFTADGKWLVSAGIDGKIIIKDPADYKTIATLIGLDGTDYVAVTSDQYYAASKKGTRFIAFRQGNKVFPAEQFDIKYNRPDKVLQALGSSDTNLVRSYQQAYYKRIRKLGIDTAFFREGFTTPDFEFANRDQVPFQQANQQLKLHLQGKDSLFALDRFNIWINEVPLYGQKGISLRERNTKVMDTSITVALSPGENRVEASAISVNGAESYRVPLIINYQPAKPMPETVHFIGIGIDQFADSRYNLQYSTKDIRDLAVKLKTMFGEGIMIDTLFNEQVTTANIRALKNKLVKTTEQDKVIVSYSGHGLLNNRFDYFLSTYNIDFDNPETAGLPYEDLEDLLDSIPARRKLMLIDACHSGEVDKEDLVTLSATPDSLVKGLKPVAYKKDGAQLGLKNSFELMQNLFVNVGKSTGATIISAAAGTEFALERNELRNGVFTYCILEAMNKYPSMKISELKKIVSERVEQLTNGLQKPTSRNEMIISDWQLW